MNIDSNAVSFSTDLEYIARQDRMREALNVALRSIRAGVYEQDLLYIAADIAFSLGDLDKSEQIVRRLLMLTPESLAGWSLFGKIRYRKDNILRANRKFNRAKVYSSRSSRVGFATIEVTGDMAAKNIKKTSPEVSFDTITFAEICTKQGYYNKALKIYYDLLQKNPENDDLKQRIKDLEKRLGRNDQ